MSMKLMAKVFDLEDIDLTSLELLVLLKLAENTSDETGECWPSYNYLARKCRCSRSTTLRVCKSLEKKLDFFSKKTRRVDNTKNLTNIYVFDFDKLERHEFDRLKNKLKGGVTQTLGGVTQTLGGVTQTLGGGVTQTPRTYQLEPVNEPVNEDSSSSLVNQEEIEPHTDFDKETLFIEFVSLHMINQETVKQLRKKSDLYQSANPTAESYGLWLERGLEQVKQQLVQPKPLSKIEIYPNELDVDNWLEWLEHRKTEHRFTYKSAKSEGIGIKHFIETVGVDAAAQRRSVENSIANGYKGLFKVKSHENNTQYTQKQQAAVNLFNQSSFVRGQLTTEFDDVPFD